MAKDMSASPAAGKRGWATRAGALRGAFAVLSGGMLGALLVAGCAGGGAPLPTSTAQATSGPSPAGSATGPRPAAAPTVSPSGTGSTTTGGIPAAARVDSVYGSVEFVKFLVAEVNRAHTTPSAVILDAYFTPGCLGCQDLREAISDLERQGQRAAADTWFVTLATPNTWSPGHATVVVQIHQKRVDFLDLQGRLVGSMAEADQGFFLTLAFDSTWRVVRWQQT